MYEADALQAAMHSDLDGNITGAVHDHVPPGTDYPYTVIGHLTETPEDTHDGDGSELTATLHVWSEAAGTKEVNDILREIDGRWHHGTLTVSGARVIHMEREFTEILRDVSAKGSPLRHAVVRYRISLEATA